MKQEKKQPKISYDKESEVLSIEIHKAKSVDSDISNNVVVDYDKKGEIVRINLYDIDFNAFRAVKKSLENFAHSSRFAFFQKS